MLPVHIIEKLNLFRDKEYTLLEKNGETYLQEKSKDGEVVLKCMVSGEALVLKEPEKNVLAYLDTAKKGARQCADIFVYVFDEKKEIWNLHINEFKRTIKTATIKKTKEQLKMGIYNARAVSAFLGFHIDNIILYSGYRIDSITSMEEEPLIQLRAGNNTETVKKINEWKKGICTLNIDKKDIRYIHKKIKLDENGCGSLEI